MSLSTEIPKQSLDPLVWQMKTWLVDHFTVLFSITWPLNGNEAGCDLVLIHITTMGDKSLRTIKTMCLCFSPFPPAPKQCWHFSVSFIPALFGGRRGTFSVLTCTEKCLLCYIWLLDKLRMWRQGFLEPFKDFCPSLSEKHSRCYIFFCLDGVGEGHSQYWRV